MNQSMIAERGIGMESRIRKRVPRPLGTTSLLFEYHKTNDPSFLEKTQKYLINQWALGNGLLGNEQYSINQLALFLEVSEGDIAMIMKDRILSTRIFDKDQQEELIQGIMGYQLMWALEDRNDAVRQAEIMKAAQGDGYKAFISGEVRQTLELKMKAAKGLGDVISGLRSGTTNIFNNKVNSDNVIQQNYLTPEKALDIINQDAVNKCLPKDSREVDLHYLEENYQVEDFVSVSAIDQGSSQSYIDREGLKIGREELLAITDNYSIHREEDDKRKATHRHEERREYELAIDSDEDPEVS